MGGKNMSEAFLSLNIPMNPSPQPSPHPMGRGIKGEGFISKEFVLSRSPL